MGSGVALSTPREHLNNIEMTIKATGLFAATARIGIGAAAKAYPLGTLRNSNNGGGEGGGPPLAPPVSSVPQGSPHPRIYASIAQKISWPRPRRSLRHPGEGFIESGNSRIGQ